MSTSPESEAKFLQTLAKPALDGNVEAAQNLARETQAIWHNMPAADRVQYTKQVNQFLKNDLEQSRKDGGPLLPAIEFEFDGLKISGMPRPDTQWPTTEQFGPNGEISQYYKGPLPESILTHSTDAEDLYRWKK